MQQAEPISAVPRENVAVAACKDHREVRIAIADDSGELDAVHLPSWLAAEDLRAGRLVSLFSAEPVKAIEIMALWPRTRDLSPKVRVTIDALAKAFLPSPPWDEGEVE